MSGPPVFHIKAEASRKVPRPRTQQANLPICSPQPPLNVESQAGKLWIPFFKVFWDDSTRGMSPRSTDCEADALTTTPSRRLNGNSDSACPYRSQYDSLIAKFLVFRRHGLVYEAKLPTRLFDKYTLATIMPAETKNYVLHHCLNREYKQILPKLLMSSTGRILQQKDLKSKQFLHQSLVLAILHIGRIQETPPTKSLIQFH